MRRTGDPLPPAFAPRRRLPALLLGLVGGLAASVVASALLSPAAYALVEAILPGSAQFQRVLRRVALLAVVVLLVWGCRKMGVRRWADLGLAWSAERGRRLVFGAIAGAAAITLLFAVDLAAGRRIATDALTPTRVAKALAGAAAVGFVEESICHGALLFPFGRFTGATLVAANGAVSALYSTAHFLRGGLSIDEASVAAGVRVWARVPIASIAHGEAWRGLFLFGALLYLIAWRQGHAWGAIGIHAGAVLAIQILGAATDPVAGRASLFWVDGLLPGNGVSLLLVVAIVATVVLGRPKN